MLDENLEAMKIPNQFMLTAEQIYKYEEFMIERELETKALYIL